MLDYIRKSKRKEGWKRKNAAEETLSILTPTPWDAFSTLLKPLPSFESKMALARSKCAHSSKYACRLGGVGVGVVIGSKSKALRSSENQTEGVVRSVSDSAYDSVVYDSVKTRLSESQGERKHSENLRAS